MLIISGKYNQAVVYTDNLEDEARQQIIGLCNQKFCSDSKIRIMPDTHVGAGCTIGTTMTITDKIVPNLVGVDIGCGTEVVKLAQKEIDFAQLDSIICSYIPSGFNIRKAEHEYVKNLNLNELRCMKHVDIKRAKLSLSSLGGGNHFIEVNSDEDGNLYLVIHSGSRHIGKQVADYYQKLAYKKLIQHDLAYLENQDYEDYIWDMKIMQSYATINRQAMTEEIMSRMNLDTKERFTTIHNYIDLDNMILRKGAISAQKGEKIVIPLNMRDGSLICIGKGNPDWNFSAPHGAGRLMSRTKAMEILSLDEFRKSMEGVWSSSVSKRTLDESPMAYKQVEEITRNIKETAEIIKVIKPLYNFKAS